MPHTTVTINVPRRTADAVRTPAAATVRAQVERLAGYRMTDADFNESDHPRGPDGKFGSGKLHEKIRAGSAAKAHFEEHGVTGEHEIHVVKRASGRYDGVSKIDDYLAKNGGNRGKTLADLKWDHDAGRIQYKAPGGGAAAAEAPKTEAPKTEAKAGPVRRVGSLELHPAGEDYAGRKRLAVHHNGVHVGHIQETTENTTHMPRGSRVASHRSSRTAYKATIKSEHEAPGAFLSRYYDNPKQAAEAIERNLRK